MDQRDLNTEAYRQGYADAAEGEPLFHDADPDYAAGWQAHHAFVANQQGYADAAGGKPLLSDADPDYAAGWRAYHAFVAAAETLLRCLEPDLSTPTH